MIIFNRNNNTNDNDDSNNNDNNNNNNDNKHSKKRFFSKFEKVRIFSLSLFYFSEFLPESDQGVVPRAVPAKNAESVNKLNLDLIVSDALTFI